MHTSVLLPVMMDSVMLKSNGEIKRGGGFSWEAVPLHALSQPGGNAVAAAVPAWIADKLNQRCTQQLQLDQPFTNSSPAAAAVHNTGQEPAAGVVTRGQHIRSSVTDGTPGPASSAQPASTHPQMVSAGAVGSAPAVVPRWTAADAASDRMSPRITHPATAPDQQAVRAAAAAAALDLSTPGETSRASQPIIVADPIALGLMIATVCNSLQATGCGHSSTVPASSPANTAVHPDASIAVVAGHPAGSICHQQQQQQLHHKAMGGGPSGALFPSSSNSSSVSSGFDALLGQLIPSQKQKKDMSKVLKAVCKTIQHRISEVNKLEWQVAEVIRAGSFAKSTSLNGS